MWPRVCPDDSPQADSMGQLRKAGAAQRQQVSQQLLQAAQVLTQQVWTQQALLQQPAGALPGKLLASFHQRPQEREC